LRKCMALGSRQAWFIGLKHMIAVDFRQGEYSMAGILVAHQIKNKRVGEYTRKIVF
jgi:hypothetical protein